MSGTLRRAESEAEIRACFPLLHELRPHLVEAELVERVRRQEREHGYELVYLADAGEIVAAAGFRVVEYLAWGRVLYVDDLITGTAARRRGYGGQVMDWLWAETARRQCGALHLDSGVQRFEAHRLYHARKMRICCHHFSRKIE